MTVIIDSIKVIKYLFMPNIKFNLHSFSLKTLINNTDIILISIYHEITIISYVNKKEKYRRMHKKNPNKDWIL